MSWQQDQSGRWYIAEPNGTSRWPTAEEEAARVREAAAPAFQTQFAAPAVPSHATHGRPAPAAAPKRSWGLAAVTGVLGLVVGGVLGAAVAGGDGGTVTTETSSSSSSSSSKTAGAQPTSKPSSKAPTKDAPKRDATNPAFGQTVTFDDGSTLTCGKPVTFKRDQFAAGGEKAKVALKAKCTFTNKSGKTFEPALTTLSMSAGGEEGDSVFQDGLDAPDNPVLDGKSVTWWSGYGVDSTKAVQLSVNVGFLDYDTITFS